MYAFAEELSMKKNKEFHRSAKVLCLIFTAFFLTLIETAAWANEGVLCC